MALLLIIASYIFGSISVARIIGSIKGVNLAVQGTRNPGATNVYKLVGPGWGILTGAFDFCKGVIPTIIAKEVLKYSYPVIILVALSVIAGHNWSLFYGFNGGRGLATTLGTMGVIAFYPGILAFIIGGALSWFLTVKGKIEVRIPFLTYPLFTVFLIIYSQNIFLLLYGLSIMLLAYYRAWQVRDR